MRGCRLHEGITGNSSITAVAAGPSQQMRASKADARLRSSPAYPFSIRNDMGSNRIQSQCGAIYHTHCGVVDFL